MLRVGVSKRDGEKKKRQKGRESVQGMKEAGGSRGLRGLKGRREVGKGKTEGARREHQRRAASL